MSAHKLRRAQSLPYVKFIGNTQTINSQSIKVLEIDVNGKVLFCTGTATITDAGSGYAKGCLYIKTDVVAGTSGIYENVGTTTSCNFDQIGVAAAAGANTALSNLAAVAINTTLVSDTDSTDDLGTTAKYWANAYVDKYYANATATIDGATAGQLTTTGNVAPGVTATDSLGAALKYYLNSYVGTMYVNATATLAGSVAGTVTVGGNLAMTNGDFTMSDGVVSVTDATTVAGTAFTFDPSLVTTGTGFLVDGTSVTSGDAFRININSDTMTATGSAFSIVDMKTTTEVFAIRDDGTVLMKGTAEGTTAAQVQSGDFVVSDGDLYVSGGETYLITDAAAVMATFKNTNAGATGVQVNYQHESASPADNDVITRVNYVGDDDGANDTNYARLDVTALDVTDATEDGRMGWSVMVNGTLTELLRIDNVGISAYSTLVVGTGAAEGTVQSNGNFDLILKTGNATTGSIKITDGAAGAITLTPDTIGNVVCRNEDTGTLGSVLALVHAGGSQANADVVGRVRFDGQDNAAATEVYGQIDVVVTDVAAANPDSEMVFYIDEAGTATERLRLISSSNSVQIGDGGAAATLFSSGNQDLVLQTGNAATGKMTFANGANATVQVAPNGTGITELYNSDAGALGSVLALFHQSASPAASDVVGRVQFEGMNTAGAPARKTFARIDTLIVDTTDGNEDGDLLFYVMRAGTVTQQLWLDSDLNGVSIGDGASDAFLSSTGSFDLVMRTGNATSGNITIADGANGNIGLNPNGTGVVEIVRSDNGAAGATLQMTHISASPAASDVITSIQSLANDSGANMTQWSAINTIIQDPTDTTEDADIQMSVIRAGTLTTQLTLDSDVNGVVVGDGAAAGYVQSSGNNDLVLRTGNASTATITMTDGAAGNVTVNCDGDGAFIVQGPTPGDDKVQIYTEQVIRWAWTNADPDGNNDIIIYNTTAPDMLILDAWMHTTVLEGGAMTATLRDAVNGGGNAVSSALDCNVLANSLQKTTILASNTIAAGGTLALNFSGNPGTATGVFFMRVAFIG